MRQGAADTAVGQADGWLTLAAESSEASAGLASSPFAMPGFFLGWILVGLLVALRLTRRGHDRKTMMAVGMGLGPLMLLVAADTVWHRERASRPLVVEPGVHLGGDLDVLVLVQGGPDEVQAVVPSLQAVRANIGTLILARVVAYEWLVGDRDNEVVAQATATLAAAHDLVPVPGARLEVRAGTPETVAQNFNERENRSAVFFAIDESTGPTLHGHE
jgi:hypothetical protein